MSMRAVMIRPFARRVEGDSLKTRCWWQKSLRHPALWGGLCSAVTTMLVYWLAAASLKTSDSVQPGDLMEEPADFDSFSEPSVACAVLKQQAERLLLEHRKEWDWQRSSPNLRNEAGAERAAGSKAGQRTDRLTASARRSQPPSIESLHGLDVQVQAVQLSLARKLLVVYADHEMWDEFVDCYLQLLWERPVHDGYFLFIPFALECSEKCGRAEELADALRHIVRFHPEIKSSNYLKASLAEWEAKHPPGVALNKR